MLHVASTVAEIGHFGGRGKHGEFSQSLFSPRRMEGACLWYICNDKVIARIAGGLGALKALERVQGKALAGVEVVEPSETLEILPFLRA